MRRPARGAVGSADRAILAARGAGGEGVIGVGPVLTGATIKLARDEGQKIHVILSRPIGGGEDHSCAGRGGIVADDAGDSEVGASVDHDDGRLPVEGGVATAPWDVGAHDAARSGRDLRDEHSKAMIAVRPRVARARREAVCCRPASCAGLLRVSRYQSEEEQDPGTREGQDATNPSGMMCHTCSGMVLHATKCDPRPAVDGRIIPARCTCSGILRTRDEKPTQPWHTQPDDNPHNTVQDKGTQTKFSLSFLSLSSLALCLSVCLSARLTHCSTRNTTPAMCSRDTTRELHDAPLQAGLCSIPRAPPSP